MNRTRRTRSNIYFNLETREHSAFAESAGTEKGELSRSEIFRQDRIAYRERAERAHLSAGRSRSAIRERAGRDEPHEETNEGSGPAD